MKVKYTGPDDSRDLALSGGFITFPRDEWVDIETAAAAGGLRAEHAVITARDLTGDWEIEDAPRKSRKKTDPAEPANEENNQ